MAKTNKIFRTSLVFAGLVGIAGLLYAGFAPFSGQNLASRLRQGPLSLDVPVIRQSLGTSCGEAAIVMAYNYAYPQTPISEQEAIGYATSQGYFTPGVPPYTSPVNMVKIAGYYADEVSSGTVLNSDQGLSLLVNFVQDGTPVIIDVLTDFSDPTSEAHFVVVTGLSLAPGSENEYIVHYNDPLTGTKESAAWSGSQGVWNAWQNNGDPGGPGWWLAIQVRKAV
jgi:hypothetical protein